MKDPVKREQKITWLMMHRELWENENDISYKNNRPLWRTIFKYLVREGLFSPNTGLIDTRADDMIVEARTRLEAAAKRIAHDPAFSNTPMGQAAREHADAVPTKVLLGPG